jgi:predicted SAM-dependent methyltransferase
VLKFNLGCGDKAAQGWVNLDSSWSLFVARVPFLKSRKASWSAAVRYWDARKPLPVKDGEADTVYASHLLEHLSRPQALELLKECRRALKPGGICRIVVPDLKGLAEQYLGGRLSGDGFMESLNFADRYKTAARGIKNLYYFLQGHPHHHKWMYDETTLVRLFGEAGFQNASPKQWRQSDIPDIAAVESEGRMGPGVGIAVEAHA